MAREFVLNLLVLLSKSKLLEKKARALVNNFEHLTKIVSNSYPMIVHFPKWVFWSIKDHYINKSNK